MSVYEEIVDALKNNKSFAVATIVATKGCTPRSPGTKMIVYGDGSTSGTVGGGEVEIRAKDDCLKAISTGETMLKNYSPDSLEDDKVSCLKDVTIFIEPGQQATCLYLIGGGHVAQSVLPYAKRLGFHCVVVDTRDLGEFKEYLKDADEVVKVQAFADFASFAVKEDSFILVCTYSHLTDMEALEAAIDKKCAYIGMLGAKHKIVPIFKYLLEKGYTKERLAQVYSPAGIDLGGETPDEVALSIVSEMQAVRYGKSMRHIRDKKHDAIFAEL